MFKILIPTDGSGVSLQAVDYAKKLVQRMEDAEVTVLSVAETSALHPGLFVPGEEQGVTVLDRFPRIAELLAEMDAQSERYAREAQGRLLPLNRPVYVRSARGDPWKVICDIAEGESFDLVLMGSTGRGRVAGIFVGSVSNKVVHHSKVPVLIVRGKEEK
ncbi:MAG: universal stress protein [Chloroflexi bacterium]|nr:universal stress protein [Chloroflexota bacterium]